MALPVPDKTWQFDVNQIMPDLGSQLTSGRRLMRTIKNSLVGFGSNPWTVRYSSNSAVAGTAGDGVDRWTADTDLVWAAGNHSWIVLRQTGIATNFELCIDLNFGTIYNASLIASPSAGFTGGTISARPTATDEFSVSVQNGWGLNGGATANAGALHVMQSTDGQVTYVIFACDNKAQGFWMLARPKNPATGWTNPSICTIDMVTPSSGVSVESMTIPRFFSPNSPLLRARGNSAVIQIFCTSEGFTNGSNSGSLLADSTYGLNAPNDFSGEYPMFPVGFASRTTGNRGRHGQIFDMWLGLDITNIGDTYPNDASRQFVHFGEFIFPWNGSVPLTA